jgi:hypothetical protein
MEICEEPGYIHSLLEKIKGCVDPASAVAPSVHQVAALIDHLDKSLYRRGTVVVKSPDVWGQNRMTQYRAEVEDKLKEELGNFELMLQAYQRRSDVAALTSATTVAAAIQPGGAGRNISTTATAVTVPDQPGIPGNLVDNANTLIGSMTALLGTSELAGLGLANSNSRQGIGLEPTIVLDQKTRYLNHLHELRRINAGDDATDAPGYGLYLMRMPVSLLPGPESQVGKGASVTLEAAFEPTTDLLAVTFRNVLILDATYQLKDLLVRALHKTIDLSKAPTPKASGAGAALSRTLDMQRSFTIPNVGSGPGAVAVSSTEIIDVYGRANLAKLAEELEEEQKDWYRHDPSVVTWLFGQLTTAHNFIRDEARRGDAWFQPSYIQDLGELAFQRRHVELAKKRAEFLKHLIDQRNGQVSTLPLDDNNPNFNAAVRAVDILTFALLIQSYYLDRTIKVDMEVMARRRGCSCGDPWALTLFEPDPSEEARNAFSAYVACKWPTHVFALDPAVDQQNQLDLFSRRSELQLALAVAVSTGQVNFNNATTYARRLETDLAAIDLNRTAVGFGAGQTTFGWRFYPRVQTPPTESNPQRIFNLLLNNGPGRDYDLRNRRIEPGLRECVALVVAPNFVPQLKLTAVSNWFDLTGHHGHQTMETTDMVRLARKLQTARDALDRVCDSKAFPPDQLELLSTRLKQLEAMLPMRIHQVALPFEGDLTASEIFTSSSSGLAPRLLTWYGEPPKVGVDSSIFIVGTGFTIPEVKTIAGGVTLDDTDMISRNVIRIVIPANARPIATEPNLARERRLVFDVHVASPNGVSDHLLVEAEPADQPPAAAPPTSAYSVSARTPTLNVVYVAKDENGTFRAHDGKADPSTPQVDIVWNDPTGTAPKKIQVTLNLSHAGGTITIPLGDPAIEVSGINRGLYRIDGANLDRIAKEYVDQLESLDSFSAEKRLPTLTTDSIDITPVGGDALDAVTVRTNNQLTIAPSPVGVVRSNARSAMPGAASPAAPRSLRAIPAPAGPRPAAPATNLVPLPESGANLRPLVQPAPGAPRAAARAAMPTATLQPDAAPAMTLQPGALVPATVLAGQPVAGGQPNVPVSLPLQLVPAAAAAPRVLSANETTFSTAPAAAPAPAHHANRRSFLSRLRQRP